ncbi:MULTISPECIES: GPW/gp25 family protein [Pseudomonas]|jgi:phage baseplate assembly protein W|uniref:Baseplate assembly protein GpW n=5 Tax=Pseudomonas TaxID=286 RepID=A0A0N9MQI6_PSEPU|nr:MULTISPECIES: GPW/gp25 family protein [Pseudomonas]ALG76523.1 baseplate assembly protein GpW [Pseudomonas putida]MBC7213087.1 GPW/gp25 family protein [Pseudomonas sp.]AMK32487.1 Baseplate assembly protein W [Pseudomonas putida]KXG81682.1 phage baseplate protein [Pseudomonas mosselii]MBA6065731.1 GPW/gp25 family protein [Pseudomonas mosselii]
MIGMDRRTGQPLSGVAHLRQSIEDILTTPLGSRRMRPEYGSQLRRYVDLPVNEGWKSAVQAEVARALGRWEPRLKLERVKVVAVLDGQVSLALSGRYLGDDALVEVTV